MSDNDKSIYSKATLFSIVALLVILAGTVVMVFYPLARDEMHAELRDDEKIIKDYNYTPLQLAGKDLYQKEGCVNCHTQTVRPLKSDVLRYGMISQPGENLYEKPFLWGSKRTGPDLARIGGVYSDEWHKAHLMNPQHFFPKSNMPKYPWLAKNKVDGDATVKNALVHGMGTHKLIVDLSKPEGERQTMGEVIKAAIAADPENLENYKKAIMYGMGDAVPADKRQAIIEELNNYTELDAMVAYLQVIGTHVDNQYGVVADETAFTEATNPLDVKSEEVLAKGEEMYQLLCFGCHAENGFGQYQNQMLGEEPVSLTSVSFADAGVADMSDGEIFLTIANGIPGAMPSHLKIMTRDEIWSLAAYVKSLAAKSAQEAETQAE